MAKTRAKLAINIGLSLAMLLICTWLIWPNPEQRVRIAEELRSQELLPFLPYFAVHLGLLAITHLCRAWRWNNLLAPIGVRLPPKRLLAISSVGFMAILALPARLGEFVRPALIRKKGEVSATAVLGTVAVERIIDGLLVSLLVFFALFALRGPDAPGWMMPTAYTALAIFASALVFLAFALRWPKQTVRFAVTVSLLRTLSPRISAIVEEKLLKLISGFLVLKDKRNLVIFTLWSILYWTANGLSLWVLALGLGLDLPVIGAFATMGLIAVGITLPNSPGLVGQYHLFTQLGLGLYLTKTAVLGPGFLFSIALHGIQVIWYISMGLIALRSEHVTFAEVAAARDLVDDEGDET